MTLTARITQILSTRPDNVNKQVEEIEKIVLEEVEKAWDEAIQTYELHDNPNKTYWDRIKADKKIYITNLTTSNTTENE